MTKEQLQDLDVSYLKIVGDRETPNENCELHEADLALVAVNNTTTVTQADIKVVKDVLNFKGNFRLSDKQEHWLVYRKPSTFKLGSAMS